VSEDRSPMNANHGRRVLCIDRPDAPTETSAPGWWLYFESSYHGDRDEHWVIARDDAQKEIARFNARHLTAIHYSPEDGLSKRTAE
jgi:hypothetical protein